MPREGTRSQTGHAAPRIFQTIDTAPTIVRKKATKAKAKAKKSVAAMAPTGVVKNKKKESTVATKAKGLAKKAAKKAKGRGKT